MMMKRKPFVKFGTLPEGMKPLGDRCHKNCIGRHFEGVCPMICRYDLRVSRLAEIRDMAENIKNNDLL